MTSLICAAGHRTARFAREEYAEDPRCFELVATGFCLEHAWQDPATIVRGDIVAVLDGRRIVRCVVDSWNRDPDTRASLIDEFGMTHRVYLDSWYTPNQPGPFGQVLLHVADAEHLRLELHRIADASRKSTREARAQAMLSAANLVVSRREKPTTSGRLEGYDVPIRLYDKRYDAHESMGLTMYMIHHPAFQRHMTWMERYHPDYYRMLTENLHEGRGPAEIAKLIGISQANARVRLYRARQELKRRFEASGDLPVTPSGHEHRVGTV